MKILVLGGTGYVGSYIIKKCVDKGISVSSMSRKQIPPHNIFSQPWCKSVEWLQQDALKIDEYKHKLKQFNAVVHSIGILLEGGMNKYFSGCNSSSEGRTHMQTNCETALLVAKEATKVNEVKSFLYISAASNPLITNTSYFISKRTAEQELSKMNSKDLRIVSLKPGLIYDSSKALSVPVASFLNIANSLNETLRSCTGFSANSNLFDCIDLDTLASCVIECALNETYSGTYTNSEIKQLFSNKKI